MKSALPNDPVIAVYLRDVDRSLLRANLKLTPGERLEKLARFARFASTLRNAGHRSRVSARTRRRG